QVLKSLPPEAQQALVEKHLLTLVDFIPKEKTKQILSVANHLKRKYAGAPKLDLRAKRTQITMLLGELTRDAKSSFIKERSNREELLSEIVHSLVGWLNPIWATVYEHRINFLHAHKCLLFVAGALSQLADNSSLGGCKCSVMNLPIQFALKNKHDRVLKRFSVIGPQNLHRIILWIWRDLFVSLLAYGSDREKSKIPDCLEDIELALGIRSLGRLVYGGKSGSDDFAFGEGDSDDDEDEDDDFEEDDEEDVDYTYSDHSSDEEDSDKDYSDDGSDNCTCNLHAPYWPEKQNRERLTLRGHVENHFLKIFELTPSLAIYNTLVNLSQDAFEIGMRIEGILGRIAGDTPNNLAAALDIYIADCDADRIASLLASYSYLLRPRDAPTLQCAVTVLYEEPGYRARSIQILEKEANECLRAICGLIRSCFANIETDANKKDMREILKLRNPSPERKARVQDWVDHVMSASSGQMHPMAFAAMMMGLPMMPGMDDGDDADILSYVDLDQDDPDLDDLRDTYRPNLKAIFEGWVHVGQTLKGGSLVLAKLYLKALEMMPWLRAADVVEEMANRLRERPNKNHVLEALLKLSTFAKQQRKKLAQARTELQKRNAAKAETPPPPAAATSTTQAPSNSASASSSASVPPAL
ncbi:hypothetical protein BJ912DRAFT_803004, partial [Pholiota molesta]